MDDAYEMLVRSKQKDESFSDEVRRVLSPKKRSIRDFMGLLSEEEGDAILRTMDERKKVNLKAAKMRLERLS